MPAVVRVKRRIDEQPLSAFVLNSKRRRVNDDGVNEDVDASNVDNKELSTLLKFAGTINEQDDSATTQYARLTKEEARNLVKFKSRKPTNVTERARREMRQSIQEQRFRVVNCQRTTLEALDNENNANEKAKEITIVDIEKQSTNDVKTVETPIPLNTLQNAANDTTENEPSTSAAASSLAFAMPSDSDTGYVYDLYLPDSESNADYVDLLDENYLSIRPFDDLIYEDRFNNDDDEYDSEDSNQENFAGNEYPDEDDDKALNSDREDSEHEEDSDTNDLAKGLNKFVFGDDDDENEDQDMASSSDDDNYYNAYRDPYIHTVDPDEEKFCEDVDSCDVDRYGLAYARYKARIMKKLKPKTEDDDDDDDEDASNKSNYDDDSSSDSCDYDTYYDTAAAD